MVRAVFLDRDGVIVIPEFKNGRSYAPRSLGNFRFFPGVLEALRNLKAAGFLLVVVTNQPDVGEGLLSESIVEEMNKIIIDTLPIDLIKVCYHKKLEGCGCRKPKPGMLIDAAKELKIDLTSSFMVGDRASDIYAGEKAGCKTVFIDLNYLEARPLRPSFIATSLSNAAELIIAEK